MHKAKEAKNDEFYTQLSDIENEMKHYRKHFKGKKIFLNCDDPVESNFWKFFSMQFDVLGLKKLTATHYNENGSSYSLCLSEYGKEPKRKELKGNGDFRSDESIALLKKCDIVVTNPPFSIVGEFLDTLMKHDKKFIYVGNFMNVSRQDVFKYFKEKRMWCGVSPRSMDFALPKDATSFDSIDANGNKIKKVNTVWFTNLEHTKQHLEHDAYLYTKDGKYTRLDNNGFLNVDKATDIPKDYYEEMAVPITFMAKINTNQFDILGVMSSTKITSSNLGYPILNGNRKGARVVIKRIKD